MAVGFGLSALVLTVLALLADENSHVVPVLLALALTAGAVSVFLE